MWFCESQPTIETDSPNNSTSGSELGVFGTVLFSSISLVDSRGKKERPVLPLALLMWAGQDHPQGWLTRKGCAQRTPLVAESLKTLQCRRPGSGRSQEKETATHFRILAWEIPPRKAIVEFLGLLFLGQLNIITFTIRWASSLRNKILERLYHCNYDQIHMHLFLIKKGQASKKFLLQFLFKTCVLSRFSRVWLHATP